MNSVDKCQYCGGKEFVEGKQDGYSTVSPANKVITLKSQDLYHVICTNCGAVVKSYVKEPKKLITK